MEATTGSPGSNANQNFYEGELKYVRWPHTATNRDELTVKGCEEVEIIERVGSDYWKVKLAGKIGLIPAKCFYPRVKANRDYSPTQISVSKHDVVGIIGMVPVVETKMLKIMKSDGSEGLVPKQCFDKVLEQYHVPEMASPTEHCGDTNKPPDKLPIEHQPQPESKAGILVPNAVQKFVYPVVGGFTNQQQDPNNGNQDNRADYLYKGGLKYVRWPHTARPDSDELTVKNGDEVEIVEQVESGFWKVKLLETGEIGLIPTKCFYPRVKAKCDHTPEAGTEEISVREDEVVGIIEKQVEGDNIMWRIMKSDGSEGLVPGAVIRKVTEAHFSRHYTQCHY